MHTLCILYVYLYGGMGMGMGVEYIRLPNGITLFATY